MGHLLNPMTVAGSDVIFHGNVAKKCKFAMFQGLQGTMTFKIFLTILIGPKFPSLLIVAIKTSIQVLFKCTYFPLRIFIKASKIISNFLFFISHHRELMLPPCS